jgi:hypothetical protein
LGELIAFSGQTGAGPPHIHFEKRTPSNEPLNPLSNGYSLADNIPPKIEAVTFYYLDSCSLFPDGERHKSFKAHFNKATGKYQIDSVVYLQAPTGIAIKTNDRIRSDGPSLNINKIRLFLGNLVWFESDYNRYDYDQTKMVDLCYDYYDAVKHKNYRHLLYEPTGKKFGGSKSFGDLRGVIDSYEPKFLGLQKALIEVYDAAGNMSEVEFSFVLTDKKNLFDYEVIGDSIIGLKINTEPAKADLRGVRVLGYFPNSGWRQLLSDNGLTDSDWKGRLAIKSGKIKPSVVKIETVGISGWKNIDRYVYLDTLSKISYGFDYELIDGGILFNLTSAGKYSPPPFINIAYLDNTIEQITTTAISAGKFAAFYKANNGKQIVRFEYPGLKGMQSKEVQLYAIGSSGLIIHNPNDNGYRVEFDGDEFYSPTLIEVVAKNTNAKSNSALSNIIEISPYIIPISNPFKISFTDGKIPNSPKIGIGRMGGDGSWQWIKASYNDNWYSAESFKPGKFALIEDNEPPKIFGLHPIDGSTVNSNLPRISFNLTDNLSGIESDENISILLDGKWLIPEYDPETNQLKTSPNKKLDKGKHLLEITVTDGAGNRKTLKSSFVISAGKSKK